jgi:hypothetical protein
MECESNDADSVENNSTKELAAPKLAEVEEEVEVEETSCFVLTKETFPRRWLVRIFKNRYPFNTTLVQYSTITNTQCLLLMVSEKTIPSFLTLETHRGITTFS